jgi:hypothetical protein
MIARASGALEAASTELAQPQRVQASPRRPGPRGESLRAVRLRCRSRYLPPQDASRCRRQPIEFDS